MTQMTSEQQRAEYRRLKSRLTRALNRMRAASPDGKLKAARALMAECSYAYDRFDTVFPYLPDDWHRWARAWDDANFERERHERYMDSRPRNPFYS